MNNSVQPKKTEIQINGSDKSATAIQTGTLTAAVSAIG